MFPITAQQTKLDLELVPKETRFDIGKFNGRIPHGFSPREPTFQVTLDAIALTPCYPAFLITTDIPEVYMHQFWTQNRLSYWGLSLLLNDVVVAADCTLGERLLLLLLISEKTYQERTTAVFDKLGLSECSHIIWGAVPPKIARKFKKASPTKEGQLISSYTNRNKRGRNVMKAVGQENVKVCRARIYRIGERTNEESNDVYSKEGEEGDQENECMMMTQVIGRAQLRLIKEVVQKTEVPAIVLLVHRPWHQIFLKFFDIPHTDAEIVSPFDIPVQHELIKESRDEVTLAKVSSQPQSTYEAASTLTEFELRRCFLDKIEKTWLKDKDKMKNFCRISRGLKKEEDKAKMQNQPQVRKRKIQRLALPKHQVSTKIFWKVCSIRGTSVRGLDSDMATDQKEHGDNKMNQE
ncbi:hypothetical protein Tco_0308352 [Tanacetum coccineum]